ncbi:MAG: DNA repair protein RecN [bacterium]|nr:DNA repair protein RecN [bacterium]
MLSQLHIKDFVLIDELEIEFSSGLNILTGETGAGKTIIIDAINAVLGERVTTDYIRSGSERSVISALFEIKGNAVVKEMLANYGLPLSDENLLLQREILASGKHLCRINDKIVTLSTLIEVGKALVDIHGQHEHQSLLNQTTQLNLLDKYGTLQNLQLEVSQIYQQFSGLNQKLSQLSINEQEKARQLDLLKFELEEINQANLKSGEDEELDQEAKLLRNAEKLHLLAQEAYQLLYGMEEQAINTNFYQVVKKLSSIVEIDPSLKESAQIAENLSYQLEILTKELNNYLQGIEFNPAKLEEVEARLDLLHKLKRKYGGTILAIFEYRDKITAQINSIVHNEEEIEEVKNQLAQVTSDLESKVVELSQKRKESAAKLADEIIIQLSDLGMNKARFGVEITFREEPESAIKIDGKAVKINSTGVDVVEFLISPNVGELLKPLSNIASGGEISRVMLAIKTILAQADEIPTLIFDEIDTGIGGKIGQNVGMKLSRTSLTRQVICITHLPQIAAYAQTHLHVEKKIIGDKTHTRVTKLDRASRIKELALLLDGHEVSTTSLKHAEELLGKAKGRQF